MYNDFARELLAWYQAHRRALPWRETRDPYAIWISEIMLQQTQAETVRPYYARWLARFPTVAALAAAPQAEVLAAWEGLGYYARARNLHRAAQQVVAEHAGRLPMTVAGLRTLPGIGPYTAGAIASIAFGETAAVLDGNVKRVLARVFDYTGEANTPRGEKDLWALADRLVPAGAAGDYNQALMDLGALVCTPRAPACSLCPVQARCLARQNGVQLARPVLRPRRPTPHHTVAVAVVRKRGRVLLRQRPAEALLGGLWQFPEAPLTAGQPAPAQLRRHLRAAYGLRVAVGAPGLAVDHAYTHFRVTAQPFVCDWVAGQPGRELRVKWVLISQLTRYPMGKIDRRIAQTLCP